MFGDSPPYGRRILPHGGKDILGKHLPATAVFVGGRTGFIRNTGNSICPFSHQTTLIGSPLIYIVGRFSQCTGIITGAVYRRIEFNAIRGCIRLFVNQRELEILGYRTGI